MSEWRPINTAPKDGTVVLLANHERAVTGWWFKTESTEEVYDHTKGDKVIYKIVTHDQSYWEYDGEWFEATHWMPANLPQITP
jgi:hypothetical protein